MRRSRNDLRARSLAPLLIVGLLTVACSTMPTPEPAPAPSPTPTEQVEEVVLVLGSWRPDDVEQMNRILDRFHEEHEAITVRFEPTNPPDYDDALQAQLKSGTAPDLFYVRSFATSRMQFEQGYLEPLDDIPGLQTQFQPEMLAAWATDEGLPYAVPFIATSHGIYYNQEVFADLDLAPPATWQGLLSIAQTIKDAGMVPFANTSGDPWTIAELLFMNLAPGFIGGRDGRLAYLEGERCFDDQQIVDAFRAVAELDPYLPVNHGLLTYADSRELFVQGQAAMFMSGSWDIAFLEASEPDFAWSVFGTPPPVGRPAHVTFHPDAGIALNAASRHKEEAKAFLSWMTSADCAEALANELPGFFPMQRETPEITNHHARAFLSLNEDRDTDARFAWEKLREGSPDGYALMQDAALAVLEGEQTPQEAAEALQTGLAQWFDAAQTCRN